MSASALISTVDVASVSLLEPPEWRADTLRRHAEGSRILTLFGRRLSDRVLVTTAFRKPTGAIELTRALIGPDGFRALTPELPELHCFERELHEQTGVRVEGHPWLKPLRYEGQAQAAMNAYPFYALTGKEVHEVQVGPIHAGVIEPGAFRFMCHGEQVQHLEIQLGYQHRGVERMLLERAPLRLAPLVETVAGDTSVAHAWAYCAAIEALTGCALEMETEVARAVALELERVAMHLAGLSGIAADIGFLQGATSYGRLRTSAINTTLRLCGSRFGRGALRPGGIGMKLPPEVLDEVEQALQLLRRDVPIVNECFLGAETVRQRLRGIGVLSPASARALGVVGVVARASGLAIDARAQMTEGAYALAPIELQRFEEGDCWARMRVRVAELDASLGWLEQAVRAFPSWQRPLEPIGALPSRQIALAVVEGWRGEVVHCLETDDAGRLAHYKVQDPSLRNWMGLAIAMRQNEISDFPVCNKSFDSSYCGHDL
jgi:Ni,Fe-hydrogenase III large subunit